MTKVERLLHIKSALHTFKSKPEFAEKHSDLISEIETKLKVAEENPKGFDFATLLKLVMTLLSLFFHI